MFDATEFSVYHFNPKSVVQQRFRCNTAKGDAVVVEPFDKHINIAKHRFAMMQQAIDVDHNQKF